MSAPASTNAVDRATVCGGKFHYRTAAAAYTAMRLLERRQKRGSAKAQRRGGDSDRHSKGALKPYRCGCGAGWCIGHSAVAFGDPRR